MMQTQTNTYLDLVFQNRNRAYGAYELRKNYNKRMIRSGIIAISAFGILAFYQGATENAKAELPDKALPSPPVVIHRIELPKEKKQTEYPKPIGDIKPLQATTAQKIQTGQFTNPLVIQNDRVKPEEK